MTKWTLTLPVQCLVLCLLVAETTAAVAGSVDFTVSDCPGGASLIPIDATGDGTASWIEPTATSTAGGVSLESQTHTPDVTTFVFNLPTPVIYTWQDSNENEATCTFVIRLQTPGVITVNNCPESPITVTTNQPSASVTWSEPTATSTTESGINTPTATHTSNFMFNVGDTIVYYDWTDGDNNVAQCFFTVRVQLSEGGVKGSQDFTITNCPEGVGVIPIDATGDGTATWIEPTATSTAGGVSRLSRSHEPGVTSFVFNEPTQVMYTWQDANSMQATCSFYINLQMAGVLTVNGCPISPIEETTSGTSTTVTWTEPTVTSSKYPQSKITATSPTSAPGLTFNVGNTDVAYYWNDPEGNFAQCVFTVSVTTTQTEPGPCDSNPCVNGMCVPNADGSGYTCECTDGYDGVNCENDVDECTSNPCVQGTCMNLVNGYSCTCNAGYTGTNCDEDLDECTSLPCKNGGTCVNMVNSFQCNCDSGYTGETCQETDECAPTNPCMNGGTCIDGLNSHTCDCSGTGHMGDACDIEIESCTPNPCQNNAACSVANGMVDCTCVAGFTGDLCETNINECSSSPCTNGQCIDGINNYTCNCTGSGYEGDLCETDVDECDMDSPSLSCHENAICLNTIGSFICTCNEGFDGDGQVCNDVDECDINSPSHSCHEYAICMNTIGSFTCTCNDGFDGNGQICNDINECDESENPLLHDCDPNATCNNFNGGFNCTCNPGFDGNGTTCKDVDECSNSSLHACDSNANCTNTDGGYNCTCYDGYDGNGFNCSDINECSNSTLNACNTNANCTNIDGDYFCTCLDGYSGDGEICEDVDECSDSSLHDCDSNANCTNTDGGYNCTCNDGYDGNGFNCSDIDECQNDTLCQNGATCMNTNGSYICECASGYNGTHCENDINECANDTLCQNGATCMNTDGSYKCECAPGYNGTHCEIDIDECASNPCMNNGTCDDRVNGYFCLCDGTGYEGVNCETNIDECTDDIHDCDVNATCTDTDGSYECACNDGYQGDGQSCTMCNSEHYGSQCSGICTCITGATCYHVDGTCNCEEQFLGQECNKDALDVDILKLLEPVLDGSNVDLICAVNLPRSELKGQGVTWTRPDGTTESGSPSNPDNGTYTLSITNAQPNTTSGTYICSTSVSLQTGETKEESDMFFLDVKAPGRIISEVIVSRPRLGETGEFNCTVYGNTDPTITWYDKNGLEIDGTSPKYEITESQIPEKFFRTKTLKILDVVRNDNGTYVCNATNTKTVASYDQPYDTEEFELVVLEKPEIAIGSVSAVSSSVIAVTWSVTFDGNAELASCTIQYQVVPDGMTEEDIIENPIEYSHNITDLKSYTDYNIDVTCTNEVGPSNIAYGGIVRTRQSEPGKPKNVAADPESSTVALITWEDPDEPNGPIIRYDVELKPLPPKQTEGKVNSLSVDGLTPAEVYNVFVRAVNVDNGRDLVGETSDIVVLTMPPAPPSPPTNVNATENTMECTVTWNEPTETNGDITKYTVYSVIRPRTDLGEGVGDPDGGDEIDISDTETTYSISKDELRSFSRYEFEVSASTVAGEGERAPADGYCYTMPGAPEVTPAMPISPDPDDPKSVTSNTFTITIQPVSNRNGNVGCYEVVVIGLEKDEDLPSGPDAYPPDAVVSYDESKKASPGYAYTAMVLNESELKEVGGVIMVGDGLTSDCNDEDALPPSRKRRETAENREATNGKLRAGTRYTAFTRAYIPTGNGQVEYSSSPLIAPVETEPAGGIEGGVIAVIVIIVLLLVAALILGGLVLYKRRLQKSGEPLTTNGTDTPMALGIVNPGMADIVDVPPIPIEQLEGEYQRKMANNNAIFQAEFKSIPESTGDVTKEVSLSELAKDKNRYINIIAYDQTRVRLQEIEDEPGSDYINACYVDGYHHPAKFIASQGPRDDTIDDFWRMVWEQNSTTIVMLTKCFEHGKDKCAQYWPDSGSETHGNLTITMEDSVVCSDYVIRKFSIAEKGDEEGAHARSVTQFHYLAWPDFGIPDYPYSMMAFLKRVRQMTYAKADKGNIVVHCSAGVGRTGTYILIDTMIEMIAKEKQVDIYNFIYKIRSQRNLLVQSIVQYIFIHRALVEEYKFGHTEVDLMNLTGYYLKLTKPDPETQKSGVDLEYKMVASQIVAHTEQEFGNKEANKEKNRLRQVVPFDRNRIKLERLIGEEHSDYINASFIDGYEHKRAYIATQGPLSNTVSDFWRMVWEEQCATIVMLTKLTEKGQEVCHQYWPGEDDSATQSYLAIQHVSEEDQGEYIVRDFQLTNTKGGGLRKIRQYHFQDWPEVGMPESGVSLIKLIGEAHKHQKSINHYPIIVHGSSGAGRTGVFCALSILLGRIQAEGVVDVFQTVRTLRQQRPHMVQDPTQYQFCYKAILNHLDSYGTYANYR